MRNASSGRPLAFGVAALAVAILALSSFSYTAVGQPRNVVTAGPARYTVVETQGHNLIVTDNTNNTLYFYTTDKDKPIGSPLKLRGSVDLNKVGQPELTPTTHGAGN